ncbi:MAG: hypothetical protein UR61_C0011G0003 [candidate division WS6 bacterium GW2011_GWE1_34_7]|uniref:Uncharacterized protein n=2 Tax=Candidatus Dojkabacteria TaxID=74243 RepID=A0A0G0B8T2_9BACT|nr:MAG: hypothetical protein UR61_C0011G0003 [candidate division WS6 bacterium GW2011_GWE1_34_7]KKP78216.1 MAG: hypothetical protein UR73_C0002G0011 [candidate division WS6 bacterium GW2011_GWF1_35_23]
MLPAQWNYGIITVLPSKVVPAEEGLAQIHAEIIYIVQNTVVIYTTSVEMQMVTSYLNHTKDQAVNQELVIGIVAVHVPAVLRLAQLVVHTLAQQIILLQIMDAR